MLQRFAFATVALIAASTLQAGEMPAVRDDFPAALEQARQRHVPIIVEAWAPW